jgi:pimeloyl-ACP methyl ester carboxylesterase
MASPKHSGHVNLPDGGSLYYEIYGDDRHDPLVLVHGGNMDRRVWSNQVGAFADEYRVITYDVRGFGKSSPKDRPHQAHADLLALLDALEISSPVHLAGLSLGGRIAVDFALCNRDRVRSLILAAPGLSGWHWYPAEWVRILLAMQVLPHTPCARSAVIEAWLGSSGMIPAMEQSHLRDTLREWTTDNADELLLRPGTDPEIPLDPPAIRRSRDYRADIVGGGHAGHERHSRHRQADRAKRLRRTRR